MLNDSHVHTRRHTQTSKPTPVRDWQTVRKPRSRVVLDRPPETLGWKTSDEEQIELRRWRGRTEITAVELLEPREPVFGTFRVRSDSGGSYDVEIRSLDQRVNSCGCIDHRVNGLGTCKHIEGVLETLRRPGASKDGQAHTSLRIEIFLDRRNGAMPRIVWPDGRRPSPAVRGWLAPFLGADGMLRPEPAKLVGVLAAGILHVHLRSRFRRGSQP